MRQFSIIAFALSLVASCNCNNCPAQGIDLNKKLTGHHDAQGNILYNAGRIVDYPTGANRLQLWVVVSPNFRNDPQEYKVAQWFTSGAPNQQGMPRSANARLRRVQESCAWNYYFSNNPLFAESGLIQAVGDGAPMVVLTGPDGAIHRTGDGGAFMARKEIETINSPDEMADYLDAAAEKFAAPKPMLQGLVQKAVATIVPAQGTFCPTCNKPTGGGDCPDCTPIKPQPNSGTTPAKLTTIMPNPRKAYDAMYATAWGLGGAVVLTPVALLGLYLRFRKRTP